jgi:hypothetical protein
MSSARDPVRLTDAGSSASPELASAIHALRSLHASREQLAVLDRSLAPQLATPTFAGAMTGGLRVCTKWLCAGLVAAVALGTVAWFERAESARPAARVVRPPVRPPAAVSAPSPAPRAQIGANDGASSAPVERPAATITPRPRRARVPDTPPLQQTAAAPEPELVLLQRAHSSLERDAAAALVLVEEHERAYAAGVFAQERELLAVEALVALGRKQAAIDRAERFVQNYPESPHGPRMHAFLRRSRDF